MKNFSDILLCSDFDGTLYKGNVSDEDAKAIRYFQEHGGAFTLSTGRFPNVFEDKKITNISLNAPIICMNGSLIYDVENNKKIFESFMSSDIIEIIRKICEHPEDIDDINIYLPTSDDNCDVAKFFSDQLDMIKPLVDRHIYKVVIHINKIRCEEIYKRIISLLPEKFGISRSWAAGVEIQNAASTKGISARKVANMLGRKTLICVGDYENDISMIKEADIGYAVANACESLKKIADRVTNAKVGGAIAEIIYSL